MIHGNCDKLSHNWEICIWPRAGYFGIKRHYTTPTASAQCTYYMHFGIADVHAVMWDVAAFGKMHSIHQRQHIIIIDSTIKSKAIRYLRCFFIGFLFVLCDARPNTARSYEIIIMNRNIYRKSLWSAGASSHCEFCMASNVLEASGAVQRQQSMPGPAQNMTRNVYGAHMDLFIAWIE